MASALNDGRALQRLLDELGRLPSIGPKTAQRIAFHLLSTEKEEARRLAQAIIDVTDQVHFCPVCFNYATGDTCSICADETRDRSTICVVENPRDVSTMERMRDYNGLYHVLHGVYSPLNNVGLDEIKIKELIQRLRENPETKEVIIATNPNVEGEATATYLSRTIRALGIRVSRFAIGLPVGSEVEYADEITLARAIEGRSEL